MNKTEINAQIAALQTLLALEKKEDFEHFRNEVARLTLPEKREKGLVWHTVQVHKEGYTLGERAFVIVEKTDTTRRPDQFRSGAPVELYSLATDRFSKSERLRQSGVIQYLDKNRMKIVLNTRDLPDWLHHGQLGVELMFDERTYLEMERALQLLRTTNEGRLDALKAVFYGARAPEFGPLPNHLQHPYLNPAQNEAVRHILAARDVAIIHGPPGTGKTTTLIHAIKLLCEKENQVLVCAPSNAAVDLMAEKLTEKGLTVVRIGNISRVDEKLISLTLESRLSAHPEAKNIKKVKIQAAQLRRDARRFKRKFGARERDARRDAYREARDLDNWAKHLEDRLIAEILDAAHVIAATLVNAAHPVLGDRRFKTAVIDEAAQALEPATWIPIARADKIILAGDPFQLPPTIKSREAAQKGLGITLLEKCVNQFSQVSFLNIQYRMNKAIMGFSNHRFYSGQLRAAPEVATHQLQIPANDPVIFIDTAGCGFQEELNPETLSRRNPGEIFILREHFLQLLHALSEHKIEPPSIAIISPYRAQCQRIEALFLEEETLRNCLDFVHINTIDAFQGQERDLVFISLVRSNEKCEVGFLSDYRRMNVAMTRAKKQLVIIGDSATIGPDPFYAEFLDYVEQHGTYRSAWEYMS
ncbi:MAG: AAA family ATPase [Bacteroidetes bacterium]|nr:MAG: AAA family ATPase [Bacteroidota bacterium]